jgi:hypothetical protein
MEGASGTSQAARGWTAPWSDESDEDLSVPHAARVYDYFLGGSEWFPVDREFAEKVLTLAPHVSPCSHANKAFLSRLVRFLSEQGVQQFIDIGCGLPHKKTTHEIAQYFSPWAKVLYVDRDSLVIKRTNAVVDRADPEHKRIGILQAVIRDTATILESEETRLLIDFNEPVALLIVATLHFLGPGDDVSGLLARYRDALPGGSFLAASHWTRDGVPDNVREEGLKGELAYASSRNPVHSRTRSEFHALFAGWDLVAPGIVWAPEWRPNTRNAIDGSETALLVGVGTK